MANDILDTVRDLVEAAIDFDGQRLAEQLTTNMLTIIGLLAFLIGYITQNIHYTLWTGLAGTAVTFLVVVPPWPFFNKSPMAWLPARGALGGISITVDGKSIAS